MAKRTATALVQPKVRMRESLRAQLEAAATQRGVSINAEINDRLEHSLDRTNLLPEVMKLAYGPAGAGILMMLGLAMEDAGYHARGWSKQPDIHTHWADDPATLELALLAGVVILYSLRPNRDGSKVLTETEKSRAVQLATEVIQAVRGDDPDNHFFTSPPSPAPCDAPTMRSLLGRDLAERLTTLPAALLQLKRQRGDQVDRGRRSKGLKDIAREGPPGDVWLEVSDLFAAWFRVERRDRREEPSS